MPLSPPPAAAASAAGPLTRVTPTSEPPPATPPPPVPLIVIVLVAPDPEAHTPAPTNFNAVVAAGKLFESSITVSAVVLASI